VLVPVELVCQYQRTFPVGAPLNVKVTTSHVFPDVDGVFGAVGFDLTVTATPTLVLQQPAVDLALK
jgi:hypothetical protein